MFRWITFICHILILVAFGYAQAHGLSITGSDEEKPLPGQSSHSVSHK